MDKLKPTSNGLAKALTMFASGGLGAAITQVLKGKLTAMFLGTAGIGILNQLTNFWGLLSTLATMGFYRGIVLHLTEFWSDEDTEEFEKHISTLTIFLMFVSLVITFLGCLFSEFFSDLLFGDQGARANLVSLILLSVPVFVAGQIYRAILNGTRSVTAMVRSRLAADVSSVIAMAILIKPFGLQGAILSYISLHAFFLLFSYLEIRKSINIDQRRISINNFDWTHIQRNLGFGVNTLIIYATAMVAAIIISRLIIDSFGVSGNGIYTMALKVGTVYLAGFTAAAGGYYFPTLAATKTVQERNICINETISFYLFIMPPVMIGLMTGGALLMTILFSEAFIPSAALLLLILPGDLFRLLAELFSMPLIVAKRHKIVSSLYSVWALSYLIFGYFLLPLYGINGIAIAYLLSQFLIALLLFVSAYNVLEFRVTTSCSWTFFRGLMAVGLSTWQLMYTTGTIEGYIISSLILGVWFTWSMKDPAFCKLVAQLIHTLKLKLR